MLGYILFAVLVIIILVEFLFIISYKAKFSKSVRQVSELRNREVDIQAKVERVKDEMKLIADLYIASDTLIHLNNEKLVYKEIVRTIESFYSCNQFILYSLDDEKRIYIKEYCSNDNNTFPNEIPYNDMKHKEERSGNTISTTVLNSKGKPLYYIKLSGKRVKTINGYMEGAFTDNDLNVFEIYAKQSSMVLDKIKAYMKMEKMALTDNLTGLNNRHYAYMRIRQEVKRANREKYPVSILFIDIDKFKSINDTFGHDIGDLALKHLAAILKEMTREYDIAIRWGGEEFVLVLPNTDTDGAYILAERLRIKIQNSNFEYCKMAVSLGIATYPYDDTNISKVISYADTALYNSKETGRNRTTIYSKMNVLDNHDFS